MGALLELVRVPHGGVVAFGREALEQQAREAIEAQEREARQAVADLCEVLGIELTAAQQADLAARDLAALAALRTHLKAHCSWP